ncbi:MAG TPA: hypothetical protein VLK85_01595 [Ramlibacter sp.]|nr:hypothetical protein [Ramlibacter sp.]
MADPRTPTPSAPRPGDPGDPLDMGESVAGEEDPGASLDLAAMPAKAGAGAGSPAGRVTPAGQATTVPDHMRPGDQAPEGTAGTGETVCPRCGGSGKLGATDCPECEGTGKITVGIGGA